jgi:hypothetical protein
MNSANGVPLAVAAWHRLDKAQRLWRLGWHDGALIRLIDVDLVDARKSRRGIRGIERKIARPQGIIDELDALCAEQRQKDAS